MIVEESAETDNPIVRINHEVIREVFQQRGEMARFARKYGLRRGTVWLWIKRRKISAVWLLAIMSEYGLKPEQVTLFNQPLADNLPNIEENRGNVGVQPIPERGKKRCPKVGARVRKVSHPVE